MATATDAALAELQASKELNRRIIEALPGGIVHVAIDGSIQTANAEALRILGISFDELTGRYTQDFAPETTWEDGQPCLPEDYPVSRALVTGTAQPPVTIGVRDANGEVSWAVFTAVPVKSPENAETIGAVVTFVDVTESKRTLLALRKSESQLRSVVDSVPSIILTTDLEGTVLFINRTAGDVPIASVVGASIFDFVEADQVDTVRSCMEGVVRTGKVDGYEFAHRGGPETNHYSVRIGPIMEGGGVAGLSFAITDINEIKKLQTRIAVSDRLASIGTLASGVAHEINNPLTYLLFSLRRAGTLARANDAPGLQSSLDSAREAAERITKTVAELAAFARPASDELQAVDVEAALESAIKMATTHIRYRAQVVRDYHPTPPVLADSSRLSQVFLNLVVNAAQSIEEGDVDGNRITVSIRPRTNELVCIEVADTGSGIPEELLPRIFEPFVTTKKVGEGTGLGLHICHNIVSSFQGSIEVRSKPTGTSFVITLPVAQRSEPTPVAPTLQRVACSEGLRILVIDDEAPIRELFEAMFAHHFVTVATSGRQGIAVLADATFDVIFCDLIMPDKTGVDVHDFIVAQRPDLLSTLVIMTGGAFTASASSFLARCEVSILSKPFTPEDVEALLAVRMQET